MLLTATFSKEISDISLEEFNMFTTATRKLRVKDTQIYVTDGWNQALDWERDNSKNYVTEAEAADRKKLLTDR